MARDPDIQLVFQERLKAMRTKRELSQRELGIRAGLNPSVASTRINRYELGIHQPDMATAQRLASSLDVPLAYLFAADDRLARAILAFSQLPAPQKDRLLAEWEAKLP